MMWPRMLTKRRLLGEVKTDHGDYILLAYCYVSGLLDAMAFYNWGVFVAMQTGNTVILCLSSAKLPAAQPWAYGSTLTALLSFLTGAILTNHLSRHAGPHKRPVLAINMLIQGLLICLSAALITANLIPTYTPNGPDPLLQPQIMGGIAPISFQTGMQIATSRILGFGGEIPVNVLTSTYAALAADTNFFAHDNKARNRRLAAVVLFFSGALCSTWMLKVGPGTVGVVWLGGGIKLVVALLGTLFLGEKEKEVALPT